MKLNWYKTRPRIATLSGFLPSHCLRLHQSFSVGARQTKVSLCVYKLNFIDVIK